MDPSQHRSGQGTSSVNGVFSGGGIKGIALAGAAAGAMEAGFRFDHAVGTSAGALVASLVGAGFGPRDLEEAVRDTEWPAMLDWLPITRVPLVGKALAMTMHKAQCAGERLEEAWGSLLATRGVRSFADLVPGTVRIVATDLTHQRGVVFPDHLEAYGLTPDRLMVARAVRMSASVPFFLRPVPLRDPRDGDVSLFSDGAMTANFPLRVARWSRVWPVVGFRFLDASHHPHARVRGPASLARAVVTAGIRAADTISAGDAGDTLIVELRVERDPMDFRLTPADAADLFAAGRSAAYRTLEPLHRMDAPQPGQGGAP
jgi:NTE family protein